MPKVYQHEQAKRDIIEHFIYLADIAGLDVAERFLANSESGFNEQASRPLMGSPLTLMKKKTGRQDTPR
ncbi:MAG: hypothetical protein HQL77_01480 [Magnetococcales bacterium]|nr:hypothetical protein [Magnetococcales bacterium]